MKIEKVLQRELSINSAVDEENRTVELSFSSEEPCERWFGTEILCHDEECVDLKRLKEIGVCLFNHDCDKPISAGMQRFGLMKMKKRTSSFRKSKMVR